LLNKANTLLIPEKWFYSNETQLPMIEYIKNNNVENGNEILNKYNKAYVEFIGASTDLHFGMIPSLGSFVEKGNIFSFCLIHDIRLSLLTYFNSEDAKKSWFEGLRILAEQGNEHIVSIGSNKFFPCNSSHGLSSKADWFYCGTCVSDSQLIQDVKKGFWSKNIVDKYGFQWYPRT
tara:strand:+ start:209 stop:736 length:528 start_codon:yes stop_codon:yes gene_type:complete